MVMLQLRELPAVRDKTVMRQLRIRELPAARDKLGNTFIIALIVLALFWGYELRQGVDERDYRHEISILYVIGSEIRTELEELEDKLRAVQL